MTPSVLAAWGVHLYTAFGAVLAFLALEASARGNYQLAFIWLAIAIIIDSTDGTLARRFRVKQVLPYFDGAKLDDIMDYLTYVFVPIVIAYHGGFVPPGLSGYIVCALPLVASGYGFCHANAKTADHFFTGFPSYWNVVVFYFYGLGSPVWFNVTVLVVLALLVFVPIRYLYPSRNRTAQRTTYVLGIVWALCFAAMIVQSPPSRWLAWVSLFFPIYYLVVSFVVHWREAGR